MNIQMTCGTAGALEFRRAEVIQGGVSREKDPTRMSIALGHLSSLILVAIIKPSHQSN